MSLTSSLQRIVSLKEDIRLAIESKGVSIASTEGLSTYPSYIAAISGGGVGTLISKTITANGTYNAIDDDADGYSSVEVDVQAGGDAKPFNIANWANHNLASIDDTDGYITNLGNIGSETGFYPTMSYQEGLSYVNIPSCGYIGDYVFYHLSSLETIIASSQVKVGSYACQGCISLSSFSGAITEVGRYAFASCTTLSSIDLTQCSTIREYAFNSTALSSIYAPNCTYLGSNAITSYKPITINKYCNMSWSCGGSIGASQYVSGRRVARFTSANDNQYFALRQISWSSAIYVVHSECEMVCCDCSFYWSAAMTSIDLSNVKYIGAYAFGNSNSLSSVSIINASNVEKCGSHTFNLVSRSGLYSLRTLVMPKLKEIPDYFMAQPSGLLSSLVTDYITSIGSCGLWYTRVSTLSLSDTLSYIGESAFNNCINLDMDMNLPAVPEIKFSTFYACNKIRTISIPVCSNIGSSAFYLCSSLSKLYAPNLITMGFGAIYGCSNLKDVNINACKYTLSYAFDTCYAIPYITLPNIESMANYTFIRCSALSKLRLLSTSIATLESFDAFYSTPIRDSSFTGTFGSIYVRNSMLTNWQQATNWTVLSSKMVGLYSFQVDDDTYWGVVGSTYGQWVDDACDNENGFISSGTSILTSDGTKYIVGITTDDTIVDGGTYTTANI